MSLIDLVGVFGAYREARRFDRWSDRATLEAHQQQRIATLLHEVAAQSAFYTPLRGQPLEQWPVIGKAEWMGQFDAINTRGLELAPLMELALDGERLRRFSARTDGLSIGLSTGTSGSRGLFVASAAERNRWAGTMLAKLLPQPWKPQRVALLLRAGNSLYDRIGAGHLRFRYFDVARPWEPVVAELRDFAPTILVAPPQALLRLAELPVSRRVAPARVISCAEVLHDFDSARIEAAFGVHIEQIYQATEGFLGATCPQGTLHLNEAQYLIEKEWLSEERARFVPVVTDLYRRVQPVIRYRLNDILTIRQEPCPCGRVSTALRAIDGRRDDLLLLDSQGPIGQAPVAIFPDLITRAIVTAAPSVVDFEVEETARGVWSVRAQPPPGAAAESQIRAALVRLTTNLGANPPEVGFEPLAARELMRKMRRVRGSTS